MCELGVEKFEYILFSSIILNGDGPLCWNTDVTLRGCKIEEVILSIVAPRSSFFKTALYIFRSLFNSILAAVVDEFGPGEALAPLIFGLLWAVFGFVLLLFAPIYYNEKFINIEFNKILT